MSFIDVVHRDMLPEGHLICQYRLKESMWREFHLHLLRLRTGQIRYRYTLIFREPAHVNLYVHHPASPLKEALLQNDRLNPRKRNNPASWADCTSSYIKVTIAQCESRPGKARCCCTPNRPGRPKRYERYCDDRYRIQRDDNERGESRK